ncbi:hypothetical protein J3E73DRAFT_361153 [Bipolaris maydis]|nr:hypothetical protein J3E73DRAFT_361153 [Bipolaris maydis]
MFTKAIFTSALLSAVSAHQNLHQLCVDLTSNDMACKRPAAPRSHLASDIEANEGDNDQVHTNMTHEFPLPTGLATGEYLLPFRDAGLHSSQTKGWRAADDADIYIPNYYNGYVATNYKAPGGPVATCGGAGGAAPVAPPASNSTEPAPSSISDEADVPTLAPYRSFWQ